MSVKFLSNAVKLMFAILLLAFVYVLFQGISQPDMQSSLPGTTSIEQSGEFDDIAPGETSLRRVGRQTLFVTRIDTKLLAQMQSLSSLVRGEGCSLELGLCFLNAKTSIDGILISQTDNAPPQLPSSIPWFGGFVDPTNGNVFDRVGRVYSEVSRDGAEVIQVVEL